MDMKNGVTPASGESPLEALRRMRAEGSNGVSNNPAQSVPPQQSSQESTARPQSQIHISTTPDVPDQRAEVKTPQKEQKSRSGQDGDILSKIQFFVLVAGLVIIPSFILPLPWGWAEYAKGVMMLMFSITLVTIEVMKIFLSGKLSFVKGFLDLGVVLLLGSFLLSTIFSKDVETSLWGIDGRLGTGFVVISAIIMFFYVARSVVNSDQRFNKVLLFGALGISLSALLSVLSFFGVNLLGIFPNMNDLFISGFPLLASAVVGVVIWGFGLLLTLIYMLRSKEDSGLVNGLIFVLSLFNIAAITLFSLNQGFSLVILTLVSLGIVFAFMMMNKKEYKNTQIVYAGLMLLLLLIPTIVFRIESARTSVVESTGAITQVALPSQVTWNIVTSTLSDSIGTGLIGLGVDTFSIFYNVHKPAFIGNFDLTVTNFSFGNSEVLTLMGNRGVIGALIWLVVGVFMAVQAIKDLSDKDASPQSKVLNIGMDILLLYLFASSFLVYYGFIIYFALFLAVTLRILLGALMEPDKAESLVMRLDLLVEQMGQSKNNTVPIALSVVAALIGVFFFSRVVNSVSAAGNVLRAEDSVVELRTELQAAAQKEEEVSFEDKETALTDIINLYSQAIVAQPKMSLYHRKKAMLLVDYMGLLVNEIQSRSANLTEDDPNADPTQDTEISALQDKLNQVIEIALEETENATENGPNVFDNWDVRGYVYAELVGLQLTSYTDSGIAAIDNAVRLNPTSYLSFFRGSQLFVVQNDLESAGSAVSRALEINPNHIPSLLLAAELSIANENTETATALFTRAKEILEAVEATENETYTLIVDRLDQLTSGEVSEELDDLPSEDDDVLDDVDYDPEDLPDEPVDTGLDEDEDE